MASEKSQALASELVDYISGEPKRHEEEQAAKMKNKDQQEKARKDRLVSEVAAKIDAATSSDNGESSGKSGKDDKDDKAAKK